METARPFARWVDAAMYQYRERPRARRAVMSRRAVVFGPIGFARAYVMWIGKRSEPSAGCFNLRRWVSQSHKLTSKGGQRARLISRNSQNRVNQSLGLLICSGQLSHRSCLWRGQLLLTSKLIWTFMIESGRGSMLPRNCHGRPGRYNAQLIRLAYEEKADPCSSSPGRQHVVGLH
jgi:hypothetical protein